MPHPQRRRGERFFVQQPVAVRFNGGDRQDLPAVTRDLSGGGVFLYMDSGAAIGSSIELVFHWPPEITLAESLWLRGRGRVVRVEDDAPGGKVGVAIAIAGYEHLKPAAATHSAAALPVPPSN